MTAWWQTFFLGAAAGLFLGGPILTFTVLFCFSKQEDYFEQPDS